MSNPYFNVKLTLSEKGESRFGTHYTFYWDGEEPRRGRIRTLRTCPCCKPMRFNLLENNFLDSGEEYIVEFSV